MKVQEQGGRWCGQCGAPWKGEACGRCGAQTVAAFYAPTRPGLGLWTPRDRQFLKSIRIKAE